MANIKEQYPRDAQIKEEIARTNRNQTIMLPSPSRNMQIPALHKSFSPKSPQSPQITNSVLKTYVQNKMERTPQVNKGKSI